jgi:hypothetical protein
MEDLMSNEFPFNDETRSSWLVSTGEELSVNPTSSSDNFTPGNWDDWMRWTPSQMQSPKPLNTQGQLNYLNNENSRMNNRRQNQNTSLDVSAPPSANEEVVPASSSIPFTFGQAIDNPPAFQFSSSSATPPVTAEQQISSTGPTKWTPVSQQAKSKSAALVSPPSLDSHAKLPSLTLSTSSHRHSPDSAQMQPSSPSSVPSSPEPPSVVDNKKKRKSSVDDDISDKPPSKQPIKKTAHNMIEKRYRTNLNDKIAALRDSVPSLRVMARSGNADDDDELEDLEGLAPAHKLNKATVLSKATEYIRHLEKRNRRLQSEVSALKARVDAYDKMAMTGGPFTFQTGFPTPDTTRYDNDPFARTPPTATSGPQAPPQGLIPVPESMSQLHRASAKQPHYNPGPYNTGATGRSAVPDPPVTSGPRNSLASKLMVGSLAGLMLMEGFASREQSGEHPEGRGLFALPFSLLSRIGNFASPSSLLGPKYFLPSLKLFLILAAFMYLITPLLDFKPRSKGKPPVLRLASAPPLASPLEVRRNAWLTAIQTVWVPQHSFLLEAAALLLKTLKLSIRHLIGWNGYSFITGITREQEAARIRAWEIALDSQLTGGDEEISTSRLLLTLLASGTLPDTPSRLMLTALHMRVLLWNMSKDDRRSWWLWLFDGLNQKVARIYWNAARDKQRMMKTSTSESSDLVEPLPDHLTALLELDCVDVLIDSIIQRAYNLAWNNPIAQNAEIDESMDSVVGDFAISSPLDAIASWWSSFVLGRVLIHSLEDSINSTLSKESILSGIDLAIRTAPPTSLSHIRALAARAVLTSAEPDIRTAHDALPPSPLTQPDQPSSPRTRLNIIQQSPISADVREALTLAKCFALAETDQSYEWAQQARARAVAMVNAYHPFERSISLLSFVAAYRILIRFSGDKSLLWMSRHGVERVAVALRVWVGRDKGRRSGLSGRARARIVMRCLETSKRLIGVQGNEAVNADEDDEGFVSGTELDAKKALAVR